MPVEIMGGRVFCNGVETDVAERMKVSKGVLEHLPVRYNASQDWTAGIRFLPGAYLTDRFSLHGVFAIEAMRIKTKADSVVNLLLLDASLVGNRELYGISTPGNKAVVGK